MGAEARPPQLNPAPPAAPRNFPARQKRPQAWCKTQTGRDAHLAREVLQSGVVDRDRRIIVAPDPHAAAIRRHLRRERVRRGAGRWSQNFAPEAGHGDGYFIAVGARGAGGGLLMEIAAWLSRPMATLPRSTETDRPSPPSGFFAKNRTTAQMPPMTTTIPPPIHAKTSRFNGSFRNDQNASNTGSPATRNDFNFTGCGAGSKAALRRARAIAVNPGFLQSLQSLLNRCRPYSPRGTHRAGTERDFAV